MATPLLNDVNELPHVRMQEILLLGSIMINAVCVHRGICGTIQSRVSAKMTHSKLKVS